LGAGQLEFLYFEYRQLAPQPYKIINETKQSIYQEKDLKAPKDGKPRPPSDIYINQSNEQVTQKINQLINQSIK